MGRQRKSSWLTIALTVLLAALPVAQIAPVSSLARHIPPTASTAGIAAIILLATAKDPAAGVRAGVTCCLSATWIALAAYPVLLDLLCTGPVQYMGGGGAISVPGMFVMIIPLPGLTWLALFKLSRFVPQGALRACRFVLPPLLIAAIAIALVLPWLVLRTRLDEHRVEADRYIDSLPGSLLFVSEKAGFIATPEARAEVLAALPSAAQVAPHERPKLKNKGPDAVAVLLLRWDERHGLVYCTWAGWEQMRRHVFDRDLRPVDRFDFTSVLDAITVPTSWLWGGPLVALLAVGAISMSVIKRPPNPESSPFGHAPLHAGLLAVVLVGSAPLIGAWWFGFR
ncbi:MAG: hypothetical protein HY898_11090 [Deltaproteobacteria bacterium]|nr:hypothetical protein [Deltaproteobacteria bacterium]